MTNPVTRGYARERESTKWERGEINIYIIFFSFFFYRGGDMVRKKDREKEGGENLLGGSVDSTHLYKICTILLLFCHIEKCMKTTA